MARGRNGDLKERERADPAGRHLNQWGTPLMNVRRKAI